MLSRRAVALLGGAALASVAAALLVGGDDADRAAPPGSGGTLAFPDLAQRLSQVQRIELRKQDATLLLQRDGERWVLPQKGNYPARPERVRETLVGLTELRLTERRTADPARLAQLGLDDPSHPGSTAILLRLLDAGGKPIAELVVGRRRVRTQGNLPEAVYVRRPGEDQSWLAEGKLALDTDPQLWVDRDIANISAERLRQVTVRRAGQDPLTLTRSGEAGAKLHPTAPGLPATDEVALDEVSRAFEFLTFLDVKPAAEAPGEPLGESRFEFTNGLAVTVRPRKAGDALWVQLQAEGGEEAARLNARWDGWAYQLGGWKEKAFLPRLEDLREHAQPPAVSAAPPAAQPGTPAQ
jgi:hypothetical protein